MISALAIDGVFTYISIIAVWMMLRVHSMTHKFLSVKLIQSRVICLAKACYAVCAMLQKPAKPQNSRDTLHLNQNIPPSAVLLRAAVLSNIIMVLMLL